MYGRGTYAGLQVLELAHPVDLVGLHRLTPGRYPFLLQSTATGSSLGRYDILFAFPGEALELHGNGIMTGRIPSSARGFLDALDES